MCITSRNSNILKPFQKAYLAFAIIIWLLITIYYLVKLVCMIVSQVTGKKYQLEPFKVDEVFKIFKLCWIIIFGLAFIFMFIGFIYDIAIIIKGQIGTFIYPFIYFIVCFAYAILSFFDYIFNEKFIYLILANIRVIVQSGKSEENQDMKRSDQNAIRDSDKRQESDKHEESDKIEENKSKIE